MGGDVIDHHQPTGFFRSCQSSCCRTSGRWQLFALLCWVLVVGGCQSSWLGGKTESLEARVKAFWDARVAGDEIKAYDYESHTKTGVMTATQYVQARSPALRYTSYEVKALEEQGNTATVTIDLRYRIIVPVQGNLNLGMTRKEQWVRLDDGLWYRESKKKGKEKTAG